MAIRMPPDMRARLEAAAESSGRTLTGELLSRLKDSFTRDEERRTPDAIRALSYMANITERRIELLLCGRDHINGNHWRDDHLVFDAFKGGINWLLDQLRPRQSLIRDSIAKGDKPIVKIIVRDPQQVGAVGEAMAQTVFSEVQDASPKETNRYLKDLQAMSAVGEIDVDDLRGSRDIAYARADAKRDLKIDDLEEEQS